MTVITELPRDLPYDELMKLCVRIRMREVEATPEVREAAKALTFAWAYGARPKKFGVVR